MNFGNDFNSSKPEDSGFVRHPALRQLATEIRDLKARIVSFFTTCFDLKTGFLKEYSIPTTAIIESKDKPSSGDLGYYQVTVNDRGFVVAGDTNPPSAATNLYRAVFFGGSGYIETPTGVIQQTVSLSEVYGVPLNAGSLKGYLYNFIVPSGVTKLRAHLVSGTVAGYLTETQCARGFPTTPGEELTICCGDASGTSFVASGQITSGRFPQYITNYGFASPEQLLTTASIGVPNGFHHVRIPGVLNPGMVVLEWYA